MQDSYKSSGTENKPEVAPLKEPSNSGVDGNNKRAMDAQKEACTDSGMSWHSKRAKML